jgi:integrase
MHMLYAIPLKVLQSLMGHKSISSTEVYTKVFALDVAARHRVQFQMPEADAVAMLKGIFKYLENDAGERPARR